MKVSKNWVVGLIPARGGSKSIALKNIHPVGGKPLIAYVFEAAQDSVIHNDHIYCSTDNNSIKLVCEELDLAVINRPRHLATDDSPVELTIIDFLDKIHKTVGTIPEMVALLQPTSPFLLAEHINQCIEALSKDSHADSSQTVTPIDHNSHAYNQRIIENGYTNFAFVEERALCYNKQLKPHHFIFGNLVVTRSQCIIEKHSCFGDLSIPIQIPKENALDLDSLRDIDYANYLLGTAKIHDINT